MLVLSRKVGEKILIGNDIALVVVEVKKGRIKLGIDAPPSVSIQRSELNVGGQPRVVQLPAAYYRSQRITAVSSAIG